MKPSRLGKLLGALLAAGLMGLVAWAQQKTAPSDIGDLDKPSVEEDKVSGTFSWPASVAATFLVCIVPLY